MRRKAIIIITAKHLGVNIDDVCLNSAGGSNPVIEFNIYDLSIFGRQRDDKDTVPCSYSTFKIKITNLITGSKWMAGKR